MWGSLGLTQACVPHLKDSAAQRGDVVYTSDVNDLLAFKDVFPEVRVFGVGGSSK